jgi:hypothetical protein
VITEPAHGAEASASSAESHVEPHRSSVEHSHESAVTQPVTHPDPAAAATAGTAKAVEVQKDPDSSSGSDTARPAAPTEAPSLPEMKATDDPASDEARAADSKADGAKPDDGAKPADTSKLDREAPADPPRRKSRDSRRDSKPRPRLVPSLTKPSPPSEDLYDTR